MPMYNRIINPVEAFQVPPEGEACSDEMNTFLDESNADCHMCGDGSIEIYPNGDEERAYPGDWIYKERGFLRTMSKSYFGNNYSLHVQGSKE